MNNLPPPSGPPVQPRPPAAAEDAQPPSGGSSRGKTIAIAAVIALLVAAGVVFFLRSQDDDDTLAEATPTTAPATTVVATTAPATTEPVVATTAAPATTAPPTTAPPTTAAPTTTAPVATTAPPTTAPPTTAPATTVPVPPPPPWWDMTYALDCGTGNREFTLVDGFFEDPTPGSELYVELRRDVYPLADGSVVLHANCFTGGDSGVNVFILGLPTGDATSPVVLPLNSVVVANDGVTLYVESFNDTLQPPPIAINRLAVIDGALTIIE